MKKALVFCSALVVFGVQATEVAKFPDMKRLADFLHGKGLKLGLYSSPGPHTCAGYEGSFGHEETDAETWADWGVDYVKYDLGIFETGIALDVPAHALAVLRVSRRPPCKDCR